MSQLQPVPFHGDTVYCVEHNGEPYAPMRPIIDNLGIGWGSQTQKLNANKERWTVTIIVTVAADGSQRETLCIPVRKLPAFLASINARKVRPELHDKLIRYQNECDDALWNYWTGKKKQREADALPQASLPAIEGPDWARQVADALRAALGKLDFAYQTQGLQIRYMNRTEKKELLKSLYIASMNSINAAGAAVRALIAMDKR